jgi:hypothetical protein
VLQISQRAVDSLTQNRKVFDPTTRLKQTITFAIHYLDIFVIGAVYVYE